jgi:ribosomal protein S18 acetylase RimI-like enzyme
MAEPGPEPAGYTVRVARPGDAKAFLSFWTDIVAEGVYVRSEEVRHSLSEYRRRFRSSRTRWELHAVASSGPELAGYLGVVRERHPVTSHVASLGIAVAAQHRSRGVGSMLLEEAFRWAREVGVEKLVLSVYPHNDAAIALYRKFGFLQEGRLARHSRKSYGYEDEILMAAWTSDET